MNIPIIHCGKKARMYIIGRNESEREKKRRDWREVLREVSWNEREVAARSRCVSSARSSTNQSAVGAAGRRRQFRADRRRNHPRPCPSLLSVAPPGAYSLFLPSHAALCWARLIPLLSALSHPSRLVPSAGGSTRGEDLGGHTPDPSGRELCLSAAFGRARPRDKRACQLPQLLSLPPLRASARSCLAIGRRAYDACLQTRYNTCLNADTTYLHTTCVRRFTLPLL